MIALDHLIFGSGHGLGSPYFDQRFYWLVDCSNGRSAGKGRLYTASAGLGAQLYSREWRMPAPGTTRRLAGETFTVFNARRYGPRVEVSWGMNLPRDLDEANAKIRRFLSELGDRQ